MARKNLNPVESVELRVSIRADRATAERIRKLFPSARVRNGSCEMRVVGERTADVAAKAEEMMQRLREIVAPPKDFKIAERPSSQK